MRGLVLLVGFVALVAGVIFAGQGSGYLTYTPPGMHPSFMIGDMHWTYYGIAIAVVGLLLILIGRRRRDMRG